MVIVTLTTDFGTADGYVGAMKGVILRLASQAVVVDLAHDLPRHDVEAAAWVLAQSAFEFPPGSVHVCVVDPGVGGARVDVVVQARGQLFVGPDNGVFERVAVGCDGVWQITEPNFRFPDAAPTFHGRDVFAPAAAALARGMPARRAGPPIQLAPRPRPARVAGTGAIVHVDRWGNLISDLEATDAPALLIGSRAIPVRRTYEDVAPGELVAYIGSAGTLEVAVREGNAARLLGVARGAAVQLADAPGAA